MRSTTLKLLSTGLFAGILVSAANAVSADPDVPIHENGATIVCTGVGSSKDNQQWGSYPIKLVFANTRGEYVAGEHVKLSGRDGALIQTDCDAPWVLLKTPAGHYTVTATLNNSMGVRRAGTQFSTSDFSHTQKVMTLEFPIRGMADFSS